MITTVTTKFQQKRKFLLILPLLVVPFLFLAFYSLGGGKGEPGSVPKKGGTNGFNMELPPALFDQKEEKMSKLDYYQRADQDSIRRREQMQQDPYHRHDGKLVSQLPEKPAADSQANFLLRQLDLLQQKIEDPKPAKPVIHRKKVEQTGHWEETLLPVTKQVQETPATEPDPELEKLDSMLDKIIRIQQPKKDLPAEPLTEETSAGVDTATNSLPAVVQEDQVLVAGGTISLRLTEAARINGVTFPKDQLAYGVVSISNDRMLITVSSLRREQSIYTMALQAYDLDGLPGIHIPGSLGRETAKQSLDQSISSMNIVPLDASPAAQVTNAGVLAARTLLSRKARQVRVAVKGGYQLLLRSMKSPVKVQLSDTATHLGIIDTPPDPSIFTPFLHHRVRQEKMELTLQGVYLYDSLLWLSLRLENHSPIGYRPGYVRWYIRDSRQQRRTAVQELLLKPVYSSPSDVLPGDSSQVTLVAFQPFSLPRDKVLVLQMAEANGAREMIMKIRGKELLKVRRYGPQ